VTGLPALRTAGQPATITRMIDLLRRRLAAYKPASIDGNERTRASVLIPILESMTGRDILLTKRTEKVKYHKGEVSFPGGMHEERDKDALTTAIRESREEIGVKEGDIDVIGRLDDMHTFTGFVITPYVGLIPCPYEFTLNPDEVSYLIYLPLSYLFASKPTMESVDFEGRHKNAPAIYYEGERIWGATCRMLLRFRKIVQDRRDEKV
jgi:8-oxo-dGTP pyrophosphatase MutT (NUDIX family)